jgi:hypothetical protein
MKRTIQTERLRMEKVALDIVGEETVHRGMAMKMIQNMPLDMLQKFMPLKTGGTEELFEFEIRIEI